MLRRKLCNSQFFMRAACDSRVIAKVTPVERVSANRGPVA